jgi:Rps23 Pro-64 3,4-dihydroxylase Tpa1-like proline 4-hydroxylase
MPFPFAAFYVYLRVTPQNIPELLLTNKGRMSREILWQICHKNEFSNCDLTKNIVKMLREQGVKTKQAARDLNIPVERARNWYYRNTGMTALDLIRLMQKYEFVRQAVESSSSLEFR